MIIGVKVVEIKCNREMNFLGYYKINSLSDNKKHLPRYQQIVGEVAKVYERDDIEDLVIEVKGHKNDKSTYGLFYLSEGAVITEISREAYENHIPKMEEIYLVKGFHPTDKSKTSYTFKSTQYVKENSKVYVNTKYGKSMLIVTDCKCILKDQEKEWLEYLNLEEFKKVLSVIEEVEVVKKETKETKIEWK